jgi:hypothetical protein
VHVDTEQAHDQLVNSRLAYVSVSRGRFDAQIYTNDAEKSGEELSRDVSSKAHCRDGADRAPLSMSATRRNQPQASLAPSPGFVNRRIHLEQGMSRP